MTVTPTAEATADAGTVARRDGVAWHGLTTDETCARVDLDPSTGLTTEEVERRRAKTPPPAPGLPTWSEP